jgi:methylated-DNA-[protein]-cysteine S-methyltransferase
MTTNDEHEHTLVSREIGSPIGTLTLIATQAALVGVYFEGHRPAPREMTDRRAPSAVLELAEADLVAYFGDATHRFRVPMAARGTELERAVWHELERIPKGATSTYGTIARTIGRPSAARAIGAAVGRNPLSIVVPCHRVLGASGSLTGFAGGLARKAWLLAHEGARTLDASQSGVPSVGGRSPY